MIFSPFFYAAIGGFVPSLIWLFFWLMEDREHPEPKLSLALAFFSGMLAIPLALMLEWSWQELLRNSVVLTGEQFVLVLLVGYALIEEAAKFVLVRSVIFWRLEFDEPVDAMVYLITAALGFASVENILYLSSQFQDSFAVGLRTGNLRFVGATLLHALSSGVLGYFIAHSFYRKRFKKARVIMLGLFFATLLHTFFNVLILSTKGERLEPVLLLLGLMGILLLFAFEHIKKVHAKIPTSLREETLLRGERGW